MLSGSAFWPQDCRYSAQNTATRTTLIWRKNSWSKEPELCGDDIGMGLHAVRGGGGWGWGDWLAMTRPYFYPRRVFIPRPSAPGAPSPLPPVRAISFYSPAVSLQTLAALSLLCATASPMEALHYTHGPLGTLRTYQLYRQCGKRKKNRRKAPAIVHVTFIPNSN